MAQIMGYEGNVSYAEESSYGTVTLSGSLFWIGDVRKFDVDIKKEQKTRWRLRPRGATNQRTPAGVTTGKTTVNCKVEWAPQATNTSADMNYMSFVAMCIGTTTGIGDTRKSVMFNAVSKEAVVEGPIKGAVCKTFSCKCTVGEDVIMNAEFEAMDYDPSAPLSVTSDLSGATDSYLQAEESDGAVLDYNNVSLSISGTQIDVVTDIEFKIDHKGEARSRLGNEGKANEVVQKPVTITGKVTMDLEDNTELLRFLGASSFTMAIGIGALVWTFTGCKWDAGTLSHAPDNAIQLPLGFTATSVSIA